MLVLHFVRELRSLEDLIAIPLLRETGGDLILLRDQVLYLVDQPVMLAVEDGVHGRQSDILVGSRIACDVVNVEKLVVEGCQRRARDNRRDDTVCVRADLAGRVGKMVDVG